MLAMDKIHLIRQLFYEQGYDIPQIIEKTGHDRKTINKYLDMTDFNQPEPKPDNPQNKWPKLAAYKSTIDEWLTADKSAPRKQRHTARKVFKRLKKLDGFDCSYRLVADYVSFKKKELHLGKSKGYIPLVHYPGEAQADFGAAQFYENSKLHDGKYLVLSFPYSNAGFTALMYGENAECLMENLVFIFENIGGVPKEIWFDNTATIVTKIIKGGGRSITDKFLRFAEHYGFAYKFMNPESGWEKGNVENKVGYARRNLLVPVPEFQSLELFNQELIKEANDDMDREHYRYNQTIYERFDEDKKAFLPLPGIKFESARFESIKTNNWGKFTLDSKYEYSVSPDYANCLVWLKITATRVIVMNTEQKEIVIHKRLYGEDKQSSMEWLPYLKAIAQKPRSLKNSGIYEMMPESMRNYFDTCKTSMHGPLLKMISELTERSGFENALKTIQQAISHEAYDPDSIEILHKRLFSDIPPVPAMPTNLDIPSVVVIPPNLMVYDKFLKKGGDVSE